MTGLMPPDMKLTCAVAELAGTFHICVSVPPFILVKVAWMRKPVSFGALSFHCNPATVGSALVLPLVSEEMRRSLGAEGARSRIWI